MRSGATGASSRGEGSRSGTNGGGVAGDKKGRDEERKFIVLGESRFEATPQGLFFCPGGGAGKKKHPCPDCHFCQWCSDARCRACLGGGGRCGGGKKGGD